MAAVTLQGTGTVLTTDFKSVKWEGLTKAGKLCTITLANAINMGNISWAFAEKSDVVPQIVFTEVDALDVADRGGFGSTAAVSTSTTSPWH